MKVSIITPVLNGENTIEHTLKSVSSQDYSEIEHIVVDGGSVDRTPEILDAWKDRISLHVVTPAKGIYHAMNWGISHATGQVIGFLNADDFFNHTGVVSEIVQCFDDPSIDACYANIVYVSPENTGKIVRYWTSRPYQQGMFETGWMPAHPTFYVRSKIYQQFGGFDLKYKFHSDYEITARLMAVHKIKTRYFPEIWVRMRTGGVTNRSIKNIVKGNLESYRACKALGLKMSPKYFITKILMRIPQFFQRPL